MSNEIKTRIEALRTYAQEQRKQAAWRRGLAVRTPAISDAIRLAAKRNLEAAESHEHAANSADDIASALARGEVK